MMPNINWLGNVYIAYWNPYYNKISLDYLDVT